MIHHAKLTQQDFTSLVGLPRPKDGITNTFDYQNVYVPKPWGGEYLVAQNPQVAIWFLSIKNGKSTSMHCHQFKRTALAVMTGFAVCQTLDTQYLLAPNDVLIIDAGVFHSTRAIGDIRVIEAETPPLKGDLIRLSDSFGRVGQGYEKPETYLRNPIVDVDPMQVTDCVEIAVKCLFP